MMYYLEWRGGQDTTEITCYRIVARTYNSTYIEVFRTLVNRFFLYDYCVKSFRVGRDLGRPYPLRAFNSACLLH